MPRIVLKDLETEKVLTVSETEATIGRDPACGMVIDGPKSKVVSGRHARIFFLDDSWWIEDSSRNGTVLDNERLQAAQRHALHVGQIVGLGESGPRLRVAVLESRKVAETMLEAPGADSAAAEPRATTSPRKAAGSYTPPAPPPVVEPSYPDNTAAMRRSDLARAGLKFEELTEPMSPAPDWLVQVVLHANNSSHRFAATAMVVKIGRSPECNVQVPADLGASVSRLHAEISIQDGGVVVRDAGSRNGTFVNGQRIDSPHPVAKRDLVMLGSGGPTFTVEDLHIVKGQPEPPPSGVGDAEVGGGGVAAGGNEPTPATAKSLNPGARAMLEPPTEPAPFEPKSDAPPSKEALESQSEQRARRLRMIVWASIAATLIIAAAILAITQLGPSAGDAPDPTAPAAPRTTP